MTITTVERITRYSVWNGYCTTMDFDNLESAMIAVERLLLNGYKTIITPYER